MVKPRYSLCQPDFFECKKKCRYKNRVNDILGQSDYLYSCENPCDCYSDNYTVVDGGCEDENMAESDSHCPPDYNTYCPGSNKYTKVAVCSSPGTLTRRSSPYTNPCTTVNATITVDDQPYTTDTQDIGPYDRCSLWAYVQGFSGIVWNFGAPYSDEYWYPWFNPYRATCGSPQHVFVYAIGSTGVTYVGNLYAAYYYTPFSYVTYVSSVNLIILTEPSGSCNTCGGPGQSPCPTSVC